MKFKPVDFWGTEQRKQKQKPKTELCNRCGCDIAKQYGYVHTNSTEYVYGSFDGYHYEDADRDDGVIEYVCPHCGYLLGDEEDDIKKYLKKGR